jgi:hypothetical protein
MSCSATFEKYIKTVPVEEMEAVLLVANYMEQSPF